MSTTGLGEPFFDDEDQNMPKKNTEIKPLSITFDAVAFSRPKNEYEREKLMQKAIKKSKTALKKLKNSK